MRKKHKSLLIILILIIIGIFGVKALFHPGFFTSHDGWHQVARLFHFNNALSDGQLPPRWGGNLLNGFGYPLFIYSYHLPWWIAEIFLFFKFNIFDAIKAVFIVTYIFSGITMYLFISKIWGKLSGLISSIIYLYTPYRFANIFVRANIGEAVSFIFFPLIFWAIWLFSKKEHKQGYFIGSIGVVGIILSHIMVVYLLIVPVFLFSLIYFFNIRHKFRFILDIFIMGLLGIGLSAYYLFPAIYYQKITVFKDIYKELYLNFFTPIKLLFYSPWGYGAIGTSGEMSRQVGLVIWLIIAISLLLLLISVFRRKINLNWQLNLIFVISFIFSVFMMTKSSINIWKAVQPVMLIDFPWRLLTITTFCGSVLAGSSLYFVKKQNIKYVLLFFLVLLVFYTNRNHLRVNEYTDIPLSLYIASELTTNTDDEYLPKWVDRKYAKDEKLDTVIGDKISFSNLKQNTNHLSFNYIAEKDTEINIHLMNFPGWIGTIDDKVTQIEDNGKGGIKLLVPYGQHKISLKYKETSIMIIGKIVSLFGIIGLVILFLYKKKYTDYFLKRKIF